MARGRNAGPGRGDRHRRPMTTSPPIPATVDPSRGLLEGLRSNGHTRDAALRELHAMLIRGAHHELRRRWELLADVPPSEIDDLAQQAADDATTAIVAKLHTFRGESRFTTWAYKFVLLEAGVRARRRAWRDREVSIDDDSWQRLATRRRTRTAAPRPTSCCARSPRPSAASSPRISARCSPHSP